jgi:hypothetical protein
MLSFGISAFLAGLAGLMIGPLGSFDLTVGFTYMLLGFAAVTLGGFTSIPGVVAGGVLIGLTEELFGGLMLPKLVDALGGSASDALKYRATLPGLFNAELDAETSDGSVRTNHPLLDGDRDDRRDGEGSDERRERRRTLRSKMGDGGKILKIRSGDGTIRIDR